MAENQSLPGRGSEEKFCPCWKSKPRHLPRSHSPYWVTYPDASVIIIKLSLCLTKHHSMKAYWEWRYNTYSLTSALDGGEWSASRPGRFTPRERAPGTHCIGGWVGSRAVLDAVVKRKIPSSRREWNLRTPIVQSVAQRYTNRAITALNNNNNNNNNIG
jgi:hypothetical protein